MLGALSHLYPILQFNGHQIGYNPSYPPPDFSPESPMSIHLSSLRAQALPELVREAQESGIDNAGNLQASELVFELIRLHSSRTDTIIGDGFLEVLPDGFGFLRSSVSHFAPGVDDIYVSPSQIRRFNLRSGDWVEGKIRIPREGERYLALLQIHSVNGVKPDKARNRLRFSSLEKSTKSKSLTWRETDFSATHSSTLSSFWRPSALALP